MNNFPSVFESIADITKDQVDRILFLAGKFKTYSTDWQGLSVPVFRSSLIATSFLENSTRTKTSFAVAIQKLGATYIDFNVEKSSLQKGESLDETLTTLSAQGISLCIMRTSISHQFHKFKESSPIKIINAGDGTNQHPTQALLDLFTMMEIGLDLKGMTVTIVGDIIHSRVSHSLIELLPLFNANIILSGPKEYLPSNISSNDHIRIIPNVDEAIAESDLLYLLRIQKERHDGAAHPHIYDSYPQQYGMNLERMKRHKRSIPVFHPGPANVGVEISQDLLKSPWYFGHEQVYNSIFIRMAIIQAILQNNDRRTSRIGEMPRTVDDLEEYFQKSSRD